MSTVVKVDGYSFKLKTNFYVQHGISKKIEHSYAERKQFIN